MCKLYRVKAKGWNLEISSHNFVFDNNNLLVAKLYLLMAAIITGYGVEGTWKVGGEGGEEFIPRHNIEFITELAKSASHPAYSIAGNNDGEQGLWEEGEEGEEEDGGGGERWLD